jgi:hypothetical protein
MVKTSSGKEGYRAFSVVNVSKHGGCPTKFGKKGKGGRYISKTPANAARKAFTELCRTKRIRGICTLIVTIRETTKNSKHKIFTYKLKRNKLSKPMVMMEGTDREYVIAYNTTIKSVKAQENCDPKKKGKTRGRRLKRTARKRVLSPNNVRRIFKSRKN